MRGHGRVAGRAQILEQVGQSGNYVELLGIVGDNNTWNRSKGFHSVVDRFPNLKMVAQQTAEFDRAKALEVMESILQKNPDIKAVFCGNDSMAMGAYQALVAAKKDTQVKVFGFDGADDVVKLIAEGKIAATGMQFPKNMAKQAAEFADQYLKGKSTGVTSMPNVTQFVQGYGTSGAKRFATATDWPHPQIEPMPDAAHYLNQFMAWIPDPALRQRILVDNPARLYGFK